MPRLLRLLTPLAVLAAVFAPGGAASADPPDLITQIVAGGACATNVGVAFDGTSLYISCADDGRIDVVSPLDGSVRRSFTVAGATDLGALSWDGVHGVLYGCTARTKVVQINTASGATTPLFTSPSGCFDGLAYDGQDDTFWTSPDSSTPLVHTTRAGAVLGSFDITAQLEGRGNSGIAAGWDRLWLANASGGVVFSADKGLQTVTRYVPQAPARISDLECDSETFKPRTAIWAISSFQRRLFANEVAGNRCATGSTKPDLTAPAPSIARDVAPNQYGWNNSVVKFTLQAVDPAIAGEPTTGVKRLHYFLEGATKGEFYANGDHATVSVFSQGVTTVKVTALDYAGNESAPAVTTVQQEFQPPNISIDPPEEGDVVALGKPFTAQYACDDAISGLLSCDVTVQGGASARASASSRDGGPLSIDTGKRGARSVTVIARDKAGNVSGLVRHFNVGASTSSASSRLCGSRRKVRITLTKKKGKIVKITAYRGKKKLNSAKGRRIYVSLKGLPKKAVKIKAVGITTKGKKVSSTRTYHPCTRRKGT